MKLLASEYYEPTRHYWYQIDLEREHEYGRVFNPDLANISEIAADIKADMEKELAEEGMFWYLGKELDQILAMIRYKNGNFEVFINLKDFDFALHLDEIIEWREALLNELK